MVKYKSRAHFDKVQTTTKEQEEAARLAKLAEEEAERQRLEQERIEAEKRRIAWEARPGPVPIGWSSGVDPGSGREFYWRDNDPSSTTTWERPASWGEPRDLHAMEVLVKELKSHRRLPKDGEWQLCLQNLWEKEEVDSVCTNERPGYQDTEELIAALTILRYFCRGPIRQVQDLVANSRIRPHEKIPQHLQNQPVVTRLVDLCVHEETDVQRSAADAIAAVCHSGHRGCQDQIAMSGNAMPRLLEMLWDQELIQAACLAMGRACERSHRGNQDALAMVPQGAEKLLELLEEEDHDAERAVHFCIFQASAGAATATRTYWERCRGFCMSLMAPKEPVHKWEQAMCHRSTTLVELKHHHLQLDNKAVRAAANIAARRGSYLTMGERALAEFTAAPEPEDVPTNEIAKKKGKESKQNHIPVALNQDPAHAHMHLTTKRAQNRQHVHEIHHEQRHATENARGSAPDVKALADMPASEAGQALKALADEPNKPEPRKSVAHAPLALDDIQSEQSYESELEREAEEHDIHHLDPALDDAGLCRIGGEVRHCQPTGFLKPKTAYARYGMCT